MTKQQNLYGSIFLLANRLQNLGDRLDREVPIKQWFLLAMVNEMEKDRPTMTEVAQFAGGTRQNTTRMLQALEQKGLVELVSGAEDRASVRVSLTEKSRKYLDKSHQSGNEMLARLFAGISEESLDAAMSVVSQMFKNIAKEM